MYVRVRFSPIIYSDDNLYLASQSAGSIERTIFGHDKEELFRNIREKIWAMSSEAIILDGNVANEYNRWASGGTAVPSEVKNSGMRDIYHYALPYAKEYKQWLRKYN